MAYPNPHFLADWKERQDYHKAELDKAQAETAALLKMGDYSSPAYLDAKKRQDHHLKAFQDSFETKFPTIQEYAAWLFRSFDPTNPTLTGKPIPTPVVDIEAFRTVEEVRHEWSRILKIVRNAEIEAIGAMPIGQPPNLRAFANSLRAVSYWRQFTGADLYPQGYVEPDFYVSVLVTVDVLEDGWHVCFMQDPSHPSPSVVNEFENVATVVFREAKQLENRQKPTNPLAWIVDLFHHDRTPAVTPDRFHFYEHIPAAVGGGAVGETFERIALTFDGKEFREPQWRSPAYETIPAVLRDAPLTCAKTSAAGQAPRTLPSPIAHPVDDL